MSGQQASLGSRTASRATVILGCLVAAALVGGVSLGSSAWAGQSTCRDKAKDANHNGVIDEDETQECGGDEHGVGGTDGADLPPVPPSSHQWSNYHWSKPAGDERKIIIRDSTINSWADKLPRVLDDWGDSSKFRFTSQQAGTSGDVRFDCDMPNSYGRVHVCSNSNYSFVGKANLDATDGGHIQRARVRLNGDVSEGDRRALTCQEVGHTLGLRHRDSTGSCMHQNATFAAIDPDAHDYGELIDITHSHGGESLTGGVNSDLNVGGGILDGCDVFVCHEDSSHGHIVTITVYVPGGPAWVSWR